MSAPTQLFLRKVSTPTQLCLSNLSKVSASTQISFKGERVRAAVSFKADATVSFNGEARRKLCRSRVSAPTTVFFKGECADATVSFKGERVHQTVSFKGERACATVSCKYLLKFPRVSRRNCIFQD